MPEAYLTIDDSPSDNTNALTDFLVSQDIPATYFVRGDNIERNREAIINAIKAGIKIGNHSYAHIPAGDLGFEAWKEDFEKCEVLIDDAYGKAGVSRTLKLFRFPYIDRGDGVRVERVFANGEETLIKENDTTRFFQAYLSRLGFAQPYKNMPQSYPDDAADCLFTYTSADWMLNTKHRGNWQIKTLDDLKQRFDQNEDLKNETHRHIMLFHDQPGLLEDVCSMIAYVKASGITFVDLK